MNTVPVQSKLQDTLLQLKSSSNNPLGQADRLNSFADSFSSAMADRSVDRAAPSDRAVSRESHSRSNDAQDDRRADAHTSKKPEKTDPGASSHNADSRVKNADASDARSSADAEAASVADDVKTQGDGDVLEATNLGTETAKKEVADDDVNLIIGIDGGTSVDPSVSTVEDAALGVESSSENRLLTLEGEVDGEGEGEKVPVERAPELQDVSFGATEDPSKGVGANSGTAVVAGEIAPQAQQAGLLTAKDFKPLTDVISSTAGASGVSPAAVKPDAQATPLSLAINSAMSGESGGSGLQGDGESKISPNAGLVGGDSLLAKSGEGLGERSLLARWISGLQQDKAGDGPLNVAQPAAMAVDKLAQSLSAIGGTAARPSGLLSTALTTTVGQPQWNTGVAEKVLWMASKNIKEAEIHLDPPELGPMQVKVSVGHEHTTVSFVVHNSVVRDALDQGAFRLREMFAEEGLDLGSVDVSDQSSQNSEDGTDEGYVGGGVSDSEDPGPETISIVETGLGLVDHYV